ncbi:unnamed protein product (macronuclear) [Paramecium tetraurelia]|uniref:Uncharacterized protein n=1 Tax=Paramecium tetraurelia TaxID=5888 RepID=A0DVM1_PARTE|nr:uncharacterized protein GSPATT00020741001 [Paramecium tetraurelia]CAK87088.1 unnamed protein product [Paramecium tetraurelia]|eukprot:XP_001454485.1 hypothetical protein (macronuclear) [Paramecium tetraurelia strain d4-2]
MINEFLDFCQKNDGHERNRLLPTRKKWKEVEDELLLKAIRKYGTQWTKIQDEIPSKDSRQCQARWKILKHKEETLMRLEALAREDFSDKDNHLQKMKKQMKQRKEIPRRYNPKFDYNEDSSSESMHLQQFQEVLAKQPNKLLQIQQQQQQQQQKREQYQKQVQNQYQNVWNAMDDKMLWIAYKIYKGAWNQITPRFQEKNPQSCIDRYQYLLQQKKIKLQEDTSSVDVISSPNDIDSSQDGSEQFDISASEDEDSTDLQRSDCKTLQTKQQQYKGAYTVQQCHTNIERILKSFSNHNLDTLPGIRESIVKLILTD